MTENRYDPLQLIRPRRPIKGISAILLPFTVDGSISWGEFEQHVGRTVSAGLTPAVNMDTGFGHLLSVADKSEVLQRTRAIAGVRGFVAGAFVSDSPGQPFAEDAYAEQMEAIAERDGIPVVFQSFGLTQQSDESIIDSYVRLGERSGDFIGFELGQMFAPFGAIYSLEVYRGLLEIPRCLGAKHSSLDRELEWRRLMLRDELRPDFRVFTGNDLAIDMVMYGSDYLLGLSSFAPDLFALRDRYWLDGDPQFFALNDVLQYLGCYTFRPPVPAYKHSAAMFLKLRGWIGCDDTHPQSPRRQATDREVLAHILQQLEPWTARLAGSEAGLG